METLMSKLETNPDANLSIADDNQLDSQSSVMNLTFQNVDESEEIIKGIVFKVFTDEKICDFAKKYNCIITSSKYRKVKYRLSLTMSNLRYTKYGDLNSIIASILDRDTELYYCLLMIKEYYQIFSEISDIELIAENANEIINCYLNRNFK